MNSSKNSFSDLEHLELLASRIAQGGVDITSDYQDWINVTFACAGLGEQARESYHTICSQYAGYKREECDKQFDNCLRTGRGDITLGTIVKMAKDHGVDTSLPRGRRPKNEAKSKEERENRFQLMRSQLCEWCEFRFNTWKNRVEIREKPMLEWKPLNDRDLSTLFSRLQESGIGVKLNDLKALLESRDFSKDYDAVREWLDSLPPYDPACGHDYIDEFFGGHLEYGDPDNADLYRRMNEKWFVGMVALWIGRVDENPLMPVYSGTQYIGKTYFIRHILPPELRSYYKEPSPREPVDKDFTISLSEVVMLFLDEFSISSDISSNTYKAIITSTQSNLRDAYGHFREVRQRKASLVGATNHQQYIRDVEGNRRYVSINLVGTKNLNENPLPYEGAYAQALYMLEHGYNPKPTREESAEISYHNRDFMQPDDCEEALRSFIHKPSEHDVVQMVSAGDLLHELGMRGFHGPSFNAVNIGKAMRRLGYTPKKVKGYSKYPVTIIPYSEQETQRKTEAAEVMSKENQATEVF